jgi:hypothetical protein
MASRLEQLKGIDVGIFNLHLFAAGACLHFISKTQANTDYLASTAWN